MENSKNKLKYRIEMRNHKAIGITLFEDNKIKRLIVSADKGCTNEEIHIICNALNDTLKKI